MFNKRVHLLVERILMSIHQLYFVIFHVFLNVIIV